MFKRRKELQGLVNASRKALTEAETKIAERNKLLEYKCEENKVLKAKIVDLENNIEFLVNNLSSKKRELVQRSNQN